MTLPIPAPACRMGCCGSNRAWAASKPGTGDDVELLASVGILRRVLRDDLQLLAKRAQQVEFEDGAVIIMQGETGSEVYVIKGGFCDVAIDGRAVATLKPRDYFGERVLRQDDVVRNARIRARGQVQLLRLTRDDFADLGLFEKLDFPKREAVGGGEASEVADGSRPETRGPTSREERSLMVEAIKTNTNLMSVAQLDAAQINAMVDVMWKEHVKKGHEIIRQGDLDAKYFYIVQDGSFEILVSSGGQSLEKAMVGTIGRGGSFGELALLYLAPRAATLVAKSTSVVWVVDRVHFKGILACKAERQHAENLKHLEQVGLLQPLKAQEKEQLAKALTEMVFKMDETVFQQGERGDVLYILVEGEVTVVKDGQEEATIQAGPGQGVVFGERALLSGEPRAAAIIVKSQTAKCLTINKMSFEMLLGSLADIIERGKDGVTTVKKRISQPVGCYGIILRADLKEIGLLGCGGFGAVFLVEHTKTCETYALKSLSKGYVIKTNMQKSVISEKNVQLLCDSPFVVKLYETYNDGENLLLLLELAIGGELYETYNRKRLYGQAAHQRFYVAGTALAFEHLHSRNILYRDLKPENLLLTDTGRVKLTDMGLAKVIIGKTFTTCGTPDYFAPEVISGQGHTLAVDWWALGILSFELMVGNPPFEAATPMETYTKVNEGILKASFPATLEKTLVSFVQELCHADPNLRLAAKKGGMDNIKQCGWYTDFSWPDMEKLTMPPPYVPKVKGKKDLENFRARKEDMPMQLPYKDPCNDWDKDYATSR